MSRGKQRNQASTAPSQRAQPRSARRPPSSDKAEPPRGTGPATSELAAHLELVATIGLLYSLFSAPPQTD